MRILVDRLIELLKWPAAVYMLFSFPAYIQSFYSFQFMTWKYVAFALGIAMFFISRNMSEAGIRTNIQIVAHECTHAFFESPISVLKEITAAVKWALRERVIG